MKFILLSVLEFHKRKAISLFSELKRGLEEIEGRSWLQLMNPWQPIGTIYVQPRYYRCRLLDWWNWRCFIHIIHTLLGENYSTRATLLRKTNEKNTYSSVRNTLKSPLSRCVYTLSTKQRKNLLHGYKVRKAEHRWFNLRKCWKRKLWHAPILFLPWIVMRIYIKPFHFFIFQSITML